MSAIAWYQVPNLSWFEHQGTTMSGYFTTAGNRLVLAGNYVLSGSAVRHEMLHALLRERGHRSEMFLSRCGGVVDCSQACVRDGEVMPVTPDAVVVDAGALEVNLTLDPAAPSSTVDDGTFEVTMTARNTSAKPVVVALPAEERPRTFWVNVIGPEGGPGEMVFALSAWQVTFQPFETKRQIFSFATGHDISNRRLPPGSYRMVGGYGPHQTAILVKEIGP